MMRLELTLTPALRHEQRQECRTCRGDARGGWTRVPIMLGRNRWGKPNLADERPISLVGCVVLGICPSCQCSGLDDDAIRRMLRRLNRPRAPMKFDRNEVVAAQQRLTFVRLRRHLRAKALDR